MTPGDIVTGVAIGLAICMVIVLLCFLNEQRLQRKEATARRIHLQRYAGSKRPVPGLGRRANWL